MATEYFSSIQPSSVTIHFMDGDAITVPESHSKFREIVEKVLSTAPAEEIKKLARVLDDIIETVARTSQNEGQESLTKGLSISREGVFFDGEPLRMSIVDRILYFLNEGLPSEPLVNFLNKLLTNPRKESVDSLYDFMAANDICLHPDGDFIAYKRVRSDYMDIYSGTIRNMIGDKPEMSLFKVDGDRNSTCSSGLHVCSRSYLPHFGSKSGTKVVICKVNPADVVAVPHDYSNAKMRVSTYEVIGELDEVKVAEVLDLYPVLPSNAEGVTYGQSALQTLIGYEGSPDTSSSSSSCYPYFYEPGDFETELPLEVSVEDNLDDLSSVLDAIDELDDADEYIITMKVTPSTMSDIVDIFPEVARTFSISNGVAEDKK